MPLSCRNGHYKGVDRLCPSLVGTATIRVWTDCAPLVGTGVDPIGYPGHGTTLSVSPQMTSRAERSSSPLFTRRVRGGQCRQLQAGRRHQIALGGGCRGTRRASMTKVSSGTAPLISVPCSAPAVLIDWSFGSFTATHSRQG